MRVFYKKSAFDGSRGDGHVGNIAARAGAAKRFEANMFRKRARGGLDERCITWTITKIHSHPIGTMFLTE